MAPIPSFIVKALLSSTIFRTSPPPESAAVSPMVSSSALAAVGYASFVVFGDSLSDNGNGSYKLTNMTWPADKAYFNGRFSNGPTYVEYLADDLGIPVLRDHAYGGSTINNSFIAGGTGFNSTIPVPATADQVQAYYKSATDKRKNAKDLVLISGGNNDAFFLPADMDPKEAAQTAADDLIKVAKTAYSHGARHFVLPEGGWPSLSLRSSGSIS